MTPQELENKIEETQKELTTNTESVEKRIFVLERQVNFHEHTGYDDSTKISNKFINQFSAEIYAEDSGSSDAYAISLVPALGFYKNGLVINFKANTANTGACTLNVDGLGAKSIKKLHDQDPADNDIESGQIITVVYDGTNFQIQNQSANIQTNNAIYGDGNDSSHTTTGNETLTSDKYYTNLTVATGDTITTAGYRIFCSGILTLAGTGAISWDGKTGGNGENGSFDGAGAGGPGGTALSDAYLKGSVTGIAGGAGGAGGQTGGGSSSANGTDGTDTTDSIGLDGVIGAIGGAAGGGDGGSGGPGGSAGAKGTITISNTRLIEGWHLEVILDIKTDGSTAKYGNSAGAGGSSGGGGGGGAAGANIGGGGGGAAGAGSGGGIIAVYAKEIVIGASASITADGGIGGTGGVGADGSGAGAAAVGGGGGGAAGSGGNGGEIILVYNTITNDGSITATGGAGGTGGTPGNGKDGGGNGSGGNDGTDGTDGTVRQFQLNT